MSNDDYEVGYGNRKQARMACKPARHRDLDYRGTMGAGRSRRAPARRMWPGEEARAKEREREGGRKKGSENFPEAGQTRDKVAARLGVSGFHLATPF